MPTAPPLLDLLPVFNAQPGATLLLSPEWIIVGASEDYLVATLTERDIIVGQHIFDAFPDNPDAPEANGVANVRASLEQVMATKQPHDMDPQHYDVPDRARPGHFVERHWKPRHTPVLNAAGEVQFIIQSVQDITASRLAERQLRESQAAEQVARADAYAQRQRFYDALQHLPAQIATYHGPDHVYQFVNPRYQQYFATQPLLGRSIREVLPGVAKQGIFALMDRVYQTGESFANPEVEAWVDFAGTGHPQQVYLNLSFHALRDGQGCIDGLLDFSTDVTEQVRARRQLEQLNQELETRVQERTREAERQRQQWEQLFLRVPAAICIFDGPEWVYEFVNPDYQSMFPGRELLGKPLLEALPELHGQPLVGILRRVYDTGEPFQATEVLVPLSRTAGGPVEDIYFDLTYLARYDEQGRIDGFVTYAHDVSEQVRARREREALQAERLAAAERRALEREELYQVFEQAPVVVALLRGPEHLFHYRNPAFQSLFPNRFLIGRLYAEAMPEIVAAGLMPELDRVYTTGQPYFGTAVPFVTTPPDGSAPHERYYDFSYEPHRENGDIVGVSIIAHDVTEQAPHYLVKIESNAVFVRARRRNPPPTPILVRYGSRYWMGHLVYTGRPVLQLYDFQDGGKLGVSAGGKARNGAGVNDALALDQGHEKRELAEARLAKLATAKHTDTSGLRTADNDLVLSLANVRNDKDFTYLRLKLRNTTTIDYAVDFTDFELVENSRKKFLGKKKNEARRSLAPAGGAESQTIPARATGYLLYAVPLYAATDRGHLEITLREKFGARVLVLKVPSKVINTADAI
ncbi:PAS domain-containing protein [Hymenobacter gelipurpurascens]|nr:PAS domain-containing protein [Hymenobacter gelipurpurascens]